ncbi:unnamed protein product [Rodentolepis nana]|uniref:DEP domain-containing protein n=1 Tax=Rodentolepis nana TaxID=102285 RepID=A0A0R3TG54_RODNA|nr:unnamed protein product [Rodentolepis nana]
MFAAAAAAHMHFLSAAAAAASFTNSLPSNVPPTSADISATPTSGVQQGGSFNWSEAMEQPKPRRDSLTALSSATPSTHSDPVSRSGLISTPPIDRESESEVGSAAATLVQQPPAPPPQFYSVASSSSCASSTSAMPLSTHSDMTKVVAALLDPDCGLSYMDGSIPLPKHTFCGYDLTNWLIRNLIDVVSLEVAMRYAQGG